MNVIFRSLKTVIKFAPIYIVAQITIKIIDITAVFLLAKINAGMMDQLVDSISNQRMTHDLILTLSRVIFVGVLIACSKLILNYASVKSSIKYNDYIMMRLIKKTQKLQYSFFDDPTKLNEFKQYVNDSSAVLDISINCMNCLFSILELSRNVQSKNTQNLKNERKCI